MFRVAALIFLGAVAGAGCATTSSAGAGGTVTVGKAAPDFTLPVLGGGTTRLADLQGQVAVIDFWASWCAPCREELPELEKLRAEYEPRGVRFLAINIDNEAATAEEAARKLSLTMKVALDGDKKVAEVFSPPTMPSSYVIDRAGVVRFVHEGYGGAPDVARFKSELDALLK